MSNTWKIYSAMSILMARYLCIRASVATEMTSMAVHPCFSAVYGLKLKGNPKVSCKCRYQDHYIPKKVWMFHSLPGQPSPDSLLKWLFIYSWFHVIFQKSNNFAITLFNKTRVLTRMSRRKCRHLKSPRSLTVSSASKSHSGCLLHQGILLTPIPFVPWQSGLPFPRYNLTSTIQGQRYPSQHGIQVTHFLSVSHQAILSTPVRSVPWQSGLPFLR